MKSIQLLLTLLVALNSFGQSDVELLTKAYDEGNPNTSLEFISEINNPNSFVDTLKSKYLLTIGVAYGKLGIPDTSLIYIDSAIQVSSNAGHNYGLVKANNTKGVLLRIQGQHEASLQAFQQALEIANGRTSPQFKKAEAEITGNIGGIFYQMKDYESAKSYSLKGLEMAKQLNDTSEITYGFLRLAIVYQALGETEKSLEYNQKASQFLEILNDYTTLIYVEDNLGKIYKEKKDLNSAIYHHTKAFEFAQESGESANITHTIVELAYTYLDAGNTAMAKEMAEKALAMASRNRFPIPARSAHDILFRIAEMQRDPWVALNHKKEYISINDSLNTAEAQERLAEVEAKYESEKKQQQIELLTTQNELSAISLEKKSREQMMVIIGAAMLLIIGIAITYFIIYQARLKEKLLTEETDNLRLRITSLIEQTPDAPEIDFEELNSRLVTPLTDREFEVFQLAISQHSNSEIAEKVFLSVNTVKFHLKKVYEKLGVTNRKEALHFAFKQEKEIN
ncbi:MAG: tetratricopeptide repeat protein [Marinoscillum sp.]